MLSPSPSPTWPGSRPTGAKIPFFSQSLDPHPSDGDSESLGSEADELEAHLDTVSIRDSDLPNPWIDNPAPTSEIYPTIIYQLKYFVNSLKTMRDPRRIWPYRRNPGDEKKVLFFDFRGYGPPPHDIGNPGDFYLDHTHKDSSRYLMYVREEDGWVCSNWSADPKRKEFKLHKHPLLKDRYLWGTEASGFMWFTGDNARKLGCYRLRDEHDPTSMIEQALSYNFYWQKLTDAQERENAEIKRRSELRIAWELENIPPTPEDIKRKEAEREKRRQYEAESQRKLEERNRRRLSALHHEEEEAGPSALTEQELTLVVPVDQGVLITNGTGVKLEELRDLPIPAKRRRKVVKARNGSQSSSDDDDESPETKRQCLGRSLICELSTVIIRSLTSTKMHGGGLLAQLTPAYYHQHLGVSAGAFSNVKGATAVVAIRIRRIGKMVGEQGILLVAVKIRVLISTRVEMEPNLETSIGEESIAIWRTLSMN